MICDKSTVTDEIKGLEDMAGQKYICGSCNKYENKKVCLTKKAPEMILERNERGEYVCENCKKVYKSTKGFKNHITQNICGIKGSVDLDEEEEEKKEKEKEKEKDDNNNNNNEEKIIKVSKPIKEDDGNVKNRDIFQCEKCKKQFPSDEKLQRHQTICFAKPSDKSGKFQCGKCKKIFTSAGGYKYHVNSKCCKTVKPKLDIIEEFECKFCRKKFATIKSYNYHRKHNNNENNIKCNEKSNFFANSYPIQPITLLNENYYSSYYCKSINFEYNSKEYEISRCKCVSIPDCNDFVFYNGYSSYCSDILYTNSDVDYLITSCCSNDWSYNRIHDKIGSANENDDDNSGDDDETEEEEEERGEESKIEEEGGEGGGGIDDELSTIEKNLKNEKSILSNHTIIDIWVIPNNDNLNYNNRPSHLVSIEVECKYIIQMKWFQSNDYTDRIGIIYYLTNDNCIGIITVPLKNEIENMIKDCEIGNRIIKIKPNVVFPLLYTTTCFCICPYDPTLITCGQSNSERYCFSMQHFYERIEISTIDWNPMEDIISIGDIRNTVVLWSLKSPECPIYYSKVGMNPVVDMKWINESKLVFSTDGGILYALSFASDIVRPKILISMKGIELLSIDSTLNCNDIYCCGDDGVVYYCDASNIHKNKVRNKSKSENAISSFYSQFYLSVLLENNSPICPFPSVLLNNKSPIMNKYSSDNSHQQINVVNDKDEKLILNSRFQEDNKNEPQILLDYRKSIIRIHCAKNHLIYETRNGLFVVVPYH